MEDAAVLRAKRAAKRAELEAELPFRPNLNPRSLRLAEERREGAGEGASRGGHGGTAAGGQGGSTEELRRELEQRLQLECPFRPDTSKPRVMGYDEVYRPPQPEARLSIAAALREGPHALARRLEEHRAEREAAVEAARKEAEEKELAECTFAPRINAAPAPVARVRGTACVQGWLLPMLHMGRRIESRRRCSTRLCTLPPFNSPLPSHAHPHRDPWWCVG